MIGELDRHRLLRLARESIRSHLEKRDLPRIGDATGPIAESRGVFVTLTRAGTLRGCLGRVEKSSPVWIGIREMAVAAATRDSRFEPVKPDELDGLTIEISVLSDLEAADGPESIRVGHHGLYLKTESKSGLLLPQVAVEHGWGAVEFLERTCKKAGLPPGAWRDEAEIYTFTCEVFGEPRPRQAR